MQSLKALLTAIGDELRGFLKTTKKYKLSEIPVAINDVWVNGGNIGYSRGFDEGIVQGKQAEYDRFWDAYQNSGKRDDYRRAFAGRGWTDETFKPKYNIVVGDGEHMFWLFSGTDMVASLKAQGVTIDTSKATKLNHMFNTNQSKTIPVIDARSVTTLSSTFAYNDKLETIEGLIVDADVQYSSTFASSSKLKEILSITGTIGKSISFQNSPLNVETMKRVINALADYSVTNNHTYSVTFSSSCWTNLEADSKAPDGGTWKDYVYNVKGWNY